MDSLNEHKVYQIQPGRVLEDRELVNDVIGIGLQHLSGCGTTNPIRDFNKAFQGLQKQRLMKPVSDLAKEHLTSNPHSSTSGPTAVLAPTPSPIAQTTSTSDALALGADLQAEQESSVQEDLMSKGGSSIEEPPSEFDKILDELVHGEIEPTLACTTLEDVSLDMDVVEPVDELSEGSDETDWETEDAGMSE